MPYLENLVTSKSLSQCLADINKSHDEALKVAALLLPPGTRVGVMLSSRQVHPSPATVRGHGVMTTNFGGTSAYVTVSVEMDSFSSFRSRYRNVCWEEIRAA